MNKLETPYWRNRLKSETSKPISEQSGNSFFSPFHEKYSNEAIEAAKQVEAITYAK
jgi:hypothetical protein